MITVRSIFRKKGAYLLMESLVYKCPNCYAELKFSAKEQEFTCEYCGSHFTEQEMQSIASQTEELASHRPKEEEQTDTEFSEHTQVYHCESCGASIMADDNTAATFCYYCHNPVDRKSTRLNSSHLRTSRMPSSA